MGVKDENALTFVFGEATLESIDGATRRSLALVPKPRVGISNRDDPSCELLIDAPPGTYRLRLTGVMARSVLSPSMSWSTPDGSGTSTIRAENGICSAFSSRKASPSTASLLEPR